MLLENFRNLYDMRHARQASTTGRASIYRGSRQQVVCGALIVIRYTLTWLSRAATWTPMTGSRVGFLDFSVFFSPALLPLLCALSKSKYNHIVSMKCHVTDFVVIAAGELWWAPPLLRAHPGVRWTTLSLTKASNRFRARARWDGACDLLCFWRMD